MSSRPNLRVLFFYGAPISWELLLMISRMTLFPCCPSQDQFRLRTVLSAGDRFQCVPPLVWVLTDYKAQGQTFIRAILDLKSDGIRGRDSHYRFCSFYVQLSRLRSSKHLYLLRRIQLSDIDFKPHPELVKEISRLKALEVQTLEDWATSANDFST